MTPPFRSATKCQPPPRYHARRGASGALQRRCARSRARAIGRTAHAPIQTCSGDRSQALAEQVLLEPGDELVAQHDDPGHLLEDRALEEAIHLPRALHVAGDVDERRCAPVVIGPRGELRAVVLLVELGGPAAPGLGFVEVKKDTLLAVTRDDRHVGDETIMLEEGFAHDRAPAAPGDRARA